MITTVEDHYLEIAEEAIIPKAHQASYLKRLKSRIASIPADETGVPLSEDSEGEGGDDTSTLFVVHFSLHIARVQSNSSASQLSSQRDHEDRILRLQLEWLRLSRLVIW